MKKLFFATICVFLFGYSFGQQTLPKIETYNGVKQLIVNNMPYIMLSGELHNSTSSCLEYMQPAWEKLKKMNLNTVIASVSWELFEPEEGKYDYKLVEGIIKDARKNNMKLVLIWFATWKNAWSTYAPEWVKKDLQRFPRMQPVAGRNSGALSAWGEATMKADARAFAELMRFIKKIDSAEQTVLMMQIENESGVLTTTRDRMPAAQQAFSQQVPAELLNYLRQNESELTVELKQMMQHVGNRNVGTWQEMFGYGADEVFMAWHVARFIEYVTKAGKDIYPIPMFANAWLDPSLSRDLKLDYPVGGPVSKMLNIWRAAAPSIDLLAPDIYLDNFKQVCAQYTIAGNPLFIPETNPDIRSAANVYYALGQHNAICFAPFAIDGLKEPAAQAIGESYGSLAGFLPFWAKHSGNGNNIGFVSGNSDRESFVLGDYRIEIRYLQQQDIKNNLFGSCGLILNTAPGEYYITGRNIKLSFNTIAGEGNFVEVLSLDEGTFINGIWKAGRRLNGDELYHFSINNKPEFLFVRLHKLPVNSED